MTRAEHCKALARSFTHSACELFERDGYLTPIVIFHDKDGHGLIVVPHTEMGEHPGDSAAKLTIMLGRTLEVEYISFISETWVKEFHVEKEEDKPDLQRGDLARMSETDPDVKTNLLVMVFAVKEWEASYSIHMTLNTVKLGDIEGLGLEPHEIAGMPEGFVPDAIKRGYDLSPPMPAPPLDVMARILEEKHIAQSVVVV